MKRKLLPALMALLVLFAVGCSKGEEEESGSGTSAPSVSDSASVSVSGAESGASSAAESGSAASGSLSGAQSGSESLAASSAAPAFTSLSGTFACLNEARYPDERAPALVLAADGGFTLRANLGDQRLATATGQYLLSGTSLTLTIAAVDEDDFLGADLETLAFVVQNEDTLAYTGEQFGLTRSGDVFAKNSGLVVAP